jgi:hypothetical protein
MRAAGVEKSGIAGVFGVSRRDDVVANVATGASFVDDRDILFDWRKHRPFQTVLFIYIAFRAVDNNGL